VTRLDVNLFCATWLPSAGVDPIHSSPKACLPANCAIVFAKFSTNPCHYDPRTLAIHFKPQILALSLSRRISHSGGTLQDRIALGIRQMRSRGAIGGRATSYRSAVSIRALIGNTENRTCRVQTVPGQETIAEGISSVAASGLSKRDRKRDIEG
jgi:hypothetical protein